MITAKDQLAKKTRYRQHQIKTTDCRNPPATASGSVPLLLRPLQWRFHGHEVIRKAASVTVKQLRHAFVSRRAHDQSGVVTFLHAIDDLRILVSGSVGTFLARE